MGDRVPSNDDFFEEQTAASGVKARMISKYFDTWAHIVWRKAKELRQDIAYVDLYCGPGRYGDNEKSTPLLVLEKAIKRPELREMLITVFNDEDADRLAQLEKEIAALPGIETLKHKPQLLNHKIGPDVEAYFLRHSTIPSLTFIDPFGYAGLTRNLIKGVTKNWGCDCVFFFNYDRINRALSTSIFTPRMEAIFGAERAAVLEKRMQSIKGSNRGKPAMREEEIVDALTEALEEINDSYVRSFRFKKGNRTTHMLVFVTKHPRGYLAMNERMAMEGYMDAKGIPNYTFYDPPRPVENLLIYEEFDSLKRMLRERYVGKPRTLLQIYEEHSLRRNFIKNNYKDALHELQMEGYADTNRERIARKGKHTFADDIEVTIKDV